MGFLTPAHADPEAAAKHHYQAANLQLNNRGQYNQGDLERVFEGKGRLTAQIVADIVQHSQWRNGVMIFAATVQHAKEIMESLPPDNSRMIAGDTNTGRSDRTTIIDDFKAMRFKYLVNVAILTVGFDAPHVSVVAIMRATESPGLLQQIIGRGLRLHDGKQDCLVLDYAENVDRFGLQHDLFRPIIRVKGSGVQGEGVNVACPACGFDNLFTGRKNEEGYGYSPDGYFLDLTGQPVMTEFGPMPSHHGRRCTGQVRSLVQRGGFVRCEHRWTSKECPECQHPNDIAARYCEACRAEIIDPNAKLQIEFARIKKDPFTASTDKVLAFTVAAHVSQSGKNCAVATFTTEFRTFKVYFSPEYAHQHGQAQWAMLSKALYNGRVAPSVEMLLAYIDKAKHPETVTAYRRRGSDFYEVVALNRPEDKLP
jgi:DNA repair protein RadD